MSVVLLAAGYGTRLYPMTKTLPKALLPIGNGVLLDTIMEHLKGVTVRKIVMVSNALFFKEFSAWRRQRGLRKLVMINDGSRTPETRLGAIRDLALALKRIPAGDDVLVLGTDNLFTWPLKEFAAFAQARRPALTVAAFRLRSKAQARKFAVVELNAAGRLTRFVEKPAHPSSTTVALCVYYIPAARRGRVAKFLSAGHPGDAPGYFVEWLVRREAVYGFVTGGTWFDVGSHDVYRQVRRRWRNRPVRVAPRNRRVYRR